MLRNNPGHVKDSVNEATEVLSGMLNTLKCLLESGVETQKKLESHLKKDGYHPETALCVFGRYPKKADEGEKRVATSPPEDRLPKKGKSGTSPSYAVATRGQTQRRDGEWQLVENKKMKKKEKKKKEVTVPSAQEPKAKGKTPRRSSLHPKNQEGGDPSGPEEGWRRLGLGKGFRSGGRGKGQLEVFGLEEDPRS